MYTHSKEVKTSGTPLHEAEKAIIMIHGRGASAESIINLESYLNLDNTAVLAPQATNHSWYPYSFMVPAEQNQPALDSALQVVDELVAEIVSAGISKDKIYFLGFSQGACLALEYVTRNAARYGGVIAFTGGLVGEVLEPANYQGDFAGTPVLITTGNPDPHVPLSRVQDSVTVLENLNAGVTLRVYNGRVHTIQPEELTLANEIVLA